LAVQSSAVRLPLATLRMSRSKSCMSHWHQVTIAVGEESNSSVQFYIQKVAL
jgi:hypothetical protein